MTENSGLNERLEGFAWGLFLVTLGGLWLLPSASVPEDAWLIGAGVIMLGLNSVRYLNRIKTSGFTITLGAVALTIGVAGMFDVRLPLFALGVIAIGLFIMARHSTPHAPRISKTA